VGERYVCCFTLICGYNKQPTKGDMKQKYLKNNEWKENENKEILEGFKTF